jgi:hypothetical protein
LLSDFVWVQFYNNSRCQIGGTGFTDSVKEWPAALALSTMVAKPRMYLGAPAFSAAGSTAYAVMEMRRVCRLLRRAWRRLG